MIYYEEIKHVTLMCIHPLENSPEKYLLVMTAPDDSCIVLLVSVPHVSVYILDLVKNNSILFGLLFLSHLIATVYKTEGTQ